MSNADVTANVRRIDPMTYRVNQQWSLIQLSANSKWIVMHDSIETKVAEVDTFQAAIDFVIDHTSSNYAVRILDSV